MRSSLIYGLACAVAVGFAPAVFAADGPCTSDIAQIGRQLGTQVGLGAPVSEPGAGQHVEKDAAGQQAGSGGAASGSRQQPGGASLAKGGSPGTVGGVAGAVGSATGGKQQDAVASGEVATSAADVRRQSEGKPTMAEQASQQASGASPANASADDTAAANRTSQAKAALQRAVDLNAKNDASCASAVSEARKLMSQH